MAELTVEKKIIDASKASSKKDAKIRFVKNEVAGSIVLFGNIVEVGKSYEITKSDFENKKGLSKLNHALKIGMVSKATSA